MDLRWDYLEKQVFSRWNPKEVPGATEWCGPASMPVIEKAVCDGVGLWKDDWQYAWFGPACFLHDVGYGVCANRAAVDDRFEQDLRLICRMTANGPKNEKLCNWWAKQYANAVRGPRRAKNPAGAKAWQARCPGEDTSNDRGIAYVDRALERKGTDRWNVLVEAVNNPYVKMDRRSQWERAPWCFTPQSTEPEDKNEE
ncbi:MAG: hypothetical protein HC927_10195 [Deltaproteobacteria bacterium]|nr:hypothetical protein [Deltaproteobacteria bacterium]